MTRLDLLLAAMVAIWGGNFSLVKVALRDFPELAFNAFRLAIASTVFLLAIWHGRRSESQPGALVPIARADWTRLVVLGIVGHLAYQLFFLAGVKRTSVGNGSLIMGTTPVVVALLTAWAGHERVSLKQWIGAALSFTGLYIVVGGAADLTGSTRSGDLLMLGSVVCWAAYSVASVPLLKRHSPLVVTGYSMTIGAALYALVTLPWLRSVDLSMVSGLSWALMTASAVLALSFAYLIWYTSIQKVGTTRTAVWSNLTPVAAIGIAALWLGEPVTSNQLIGSVAIFAGLFITRRA